VFSVVLSASRSSSIQNADSSASSRTVFILEMKSGFDFDLRFQIRSIPQESRLKGKNALECVRNCSTRSR
jgi:hypothetical protein